MPGYMDGNRVVGITGEYMLVGGVVMIGGELMGLEPEAPEVEDAGCMWCWDPGGRKAPGLLNGGNAERWSPKYRLWRLACCCCWWCWAAMMVLRSAMLSGEEGSFQGDPGWLAMKRRSALVGMPPRPAAGNGEGRIVNEVFCFRSSLELCVIEDCSWQ